jgi:hypothetical protein
VTDFNKSPERQWVYVVECGGRHKIGYTGNIERRMRQFDSTQFPYPITLTMAIRVESAQKLEAWLHEHYAEDRVRGEWFEFDLPTGAELLDLLHHIAKHSGSEICRDGLYGKREYLFPRVEETA